MVTHPYRKRYCATTLLTRVKNPIKLAREMLVRGEHDGSGDGNSGDDGDPAGGAGGAQGHCCLSGEGAEKLAEAWGLEMVDPKYFWTRKRWEQHRRGLGKRTRRTQHFGPRSPTSPRDGDNENYSSHLSKRSKTFIKSLSSYPGEDHGGEGWNGIEYLPQGTVGCVALDREGAMCVATSTGGLTNKLAGRIGDTPTAGAGFWAEEWAYYPPPLPPLPENMSGSVIDELISGFQSMFFGDCLPSQKPPEGYHQIPNEKEPTPQLRAIAISGTGNGDSFLRLCACRTAGAIVRFSPPPPGRLVPIRTLASAVNQITGPGGELQRSAGDRWGKTGEGEAGMIGIEFVDDGKGNAKGEVVFDFNCSGLFRCWTDAEGREKAMVFREEY